MRRKNDFLLLLLFIDSYCLGVGVRRDIFRVVVLFLALRDFYRVHEATSGHLIRMGEKCGHTVRLSLMDEEISRINFGEVKG